MHFSDLFPRLKSHAVPVNISGPLLDHGYNVAEQEVVYFQEQMLSEQLLFSQNLKLEGCSRPCH